ncbi:lipopolysaccharide biosynthesis protein [Methanosarcina sp.]|uniref:lipopolysaccharide biosynthesis protein n=1 Tax=Methanosarcina sp. TaxID=2213 RepID=UPI003BB5A2E7
MYLKKIVSNSKIFRHIEDPFIQNSLYIMFSSIFGAGFGFIFWIFAAKFYSTENVGVATALISSMGFLVLLSKAGLDFSIIRFFSAGERNKVFNTSLIVTTLLAILFGLIYIFGIDIFSPELYLLKSPLNAALFIIILVINSITTLTGISFISDRKGKYHCLQSIITGSRLLFLIPFINFKAIGIYSAVGISFFFSLLVSIYLITKSGIKLGYVIDKTYLKNSFEFSAGNYLVSLFMLGPTMILPVLILNILGAENAAYYFIAYSISSLLFMIPNSISLSLFVEGSHGEEMKKTVLKSLFLIYSLLIPSIAILCLFGGNILKIVSIEYAEKGLELLQLLAISYIFLGISQTYFSIKRIQNSILNIVFINGFSFISLIGLSYKFMTTYGIIGVGYASILSNALMCILIIGAILWKDGWFKDISFEKMSKPELKANEP